MRLPRALAAIVVALFLSGFAGSAHGQVPPRCDAATGSGEPLTLVIEQPLPGSGYVRNAPDCPEEVLVSGFATVGLPLLDFYLTLDSSGSTARCSGSDIDEDGVIGIPGLGGCSDPDDSVLAAEVRAFRDFVATLDPARSRVSIIQFSNPEGALLVGERQRIVQSLTSDFALVNLALGEIFAAGAGGATDYGGGIQLIRDEAAANGDPINRQQVAYFTSDGLPSFPMAPFATEEPADSQAGLDAADLAAADGIVINTFSVGFLPSVTQDPIFPRRCEQVPPGGGPPIETSTIECIALRANGEYFASSDPAEILERMLQAQPVSVESVTAFNDTLSTSVVADLAADGGYFADVPVALDVINFLRVVAVATDGTTCSAETDFLPQCLPMECPPTVELQCGAVPPPDPASVAVDNGYGPDVVVVHDGDASDGATCPETITRTYRATASSGAEATCTQSIVLDDTIPPVPMALLFALPPDEPMSAVSACSAPRSAAFQVTGAASDNCDPDPTLAARLLVRHHDVVNGACEERVDFVDVDLDEIVEIRLVAPPCPAGRPRPPRSSLAVNSDGLKVVTGESVELEVTATDDCGNAASAQHDPTTTPSPHCEQQLPDGTCCPAIGAPSPPRCSEAPCGS